MSKKTKEPPKRANHKGNIKFPNHLRGQTTRATSSSQSCHPPPPPPPHVTRSISNERGGPHEKMPSLEKPSPTKYRPPTHYITPLTHSSTVLWLFKIYWELWLYIKISYLKILRTVIIYQNQLFENFENQQVNEYIYLFSYTHVDNRRASVPNSKNRPRLVSGTLHTLWEIFSECFTLTS
jgi:hypothetical protein